MPPSLPLLLQEKKHLIYLAKSTHKTSCVCLEKPGLHVPNILIFIEHPSEFIRVSEIKKCLYHEGLIKLTPSLQHVEE